MGLALSSAAQVSLIDLVGVNFFPLYRVVGPVVFFLSLLLVWGGLRLFVTVFLRVAIIIRYRGCGVWVWIAFWGTLFQLAVSPFNWIDTVMQNVGRKVGLMLGERGYPGTRSGGDRRAERGQPAEEVPMVAGQSRRGRLNCPRTRLWSGGRGHCELSPRKINKSVKCGR
jgi:hypothetical protein